MPGWRILLPFVVAVIAAATPAVRAQDCPCNCYFGTDCETGDFCNWGFLLEEDSCWWRKPKPPGGVGSGCNRDHGSYGRCDGKCMPVGGASAGKSVVGGETTDDLLVGVAAWGRALTDISLAGGGTPTPEWSRRIAAIDFDNPTVSYGLWRMVVEVLMLSRGETYVSFPPDDAYSLWEVAVGDLRGEPAARRNGDVAIRALLAEIREKGTGRKILERIDVTALDRAFYGRFCDSPDLRACLYERIADMGAVIGAGAGAEPAQAAAAGEGPVHPDCPGCPGDVELDDGVNFGDVLAILSFWGDTDFPAGDLDGDGEVGFGDLVGVLSRWGPCAQS
jgi:hypothetical protein